MSVIDEHRLVERRAIPQHAMTIQTNDVRDEQVSMLRLGGNPAWQHRHTYAGFGPTLLATSYGERD